MEQAAILVNNAENQFDAAWKRLTAVLGLTTLEPTPVEGNLDEPPLLYDFEETYAWLVENSPELQAARSTVARAQFAIQRARVEPIPNVDVQAWLQHDNDTGYDVAQVQVGVPVPLFNRNQGGVRAAFAQLRRASEETRRVELSLRDRLAESFRRYENARQQAERYRRRIIPKSIESLELVRDGYQEGEFTFVQVLVAQRTYFQVNLAYVEALTQLWRSSVGISGLLLTDESTFETVPAAQAPVMP